MALNAGEREARRRALAAGLVLAALTVALYLPVRHHAWLNYDDDVYITRVPEVRQGLSPEGVSWAFRSVDGANWFPLTRLSWLVDWQLHGLHPGGFLLSNVLLHAATSALLLLAFARMTGQIGRSAFVAAVFALHPLHVESVAWAAARKDPLSGLFFALALWLHARGGSGPRPPLQNAAVFACAALGLMCKPTLVTLPFVLLLLDAWPLDRLRRPHAPQRWDPGRVRAAVLEKLPLLLLVAVASAVTFAAQQGGGTVVSLERLPFPVRLANALVAYAGYLGSAFWPSGLAVIYPHPGESLPGWQVAAAALLLAALSAGALLALRRRPALAVGWFWYLGTLVPVIGLVQVGSQSMADRYTYLPLVGLAIAVAWGVPPLAGRSARVAAVAAALAVAALAAATAAQLRHWRDSEALFSHAIAVTTDNAIAHAHLGSALLDGGDLAGGVAHFRESIRIRPDAERVANNLAWVLATAEEPEIRNDYLAVRLAERAVRLTAGRDASVLDTLAAAYASAGRFDDAERSALRGLDRAEESGDEDLAREIRERLALYRAGSPYREPLPAPSAGRRAE